MPDPGRNDPCPCGSGQKYKKCCLPREEAARAAERPRVTARDTVMPNVLRFAYSSQFDGDHAVADRLFWADTLDGVDEREAGDLVESEDAQVKYNAWFVWDLDIEDTTTVADMFLEQRGRTLDAAERAYVERMRRSCLSLYQVDSVDRGRGVALRDLLTKESVFVHERLGSEQIVPSDLLAARVVPNEDGLPMFEGGLYLYDVADKAALLAELKRYRRKYTRRFPGSDHVGFLKRHGMIFNWWWVTRVVFRPMPALTTADGDEVVLAKSVFDVPDPVALRAALDAAPEAERDDEDEHVYTWGEDATGFRRILGTLRIEGERLRLETMSRNRDARGREWLARIAPGIAFRATALESVGSVLERTRAAEPQGDDHLEPDVKTQLEREMMDAHYRRWLDEPVPALANATPRAAAASRRLRPLLIDLLREFDNRYQHAIRRGIQAYDTSWLWEALGVSRPN
jgi:hypothetical protein